MIYLNESTGTITYIKNGKEFDLQIKNRRDLDNNEIFVSNVRSSEYEREISGRRGISYYNFASYIISDDIEYVHIKNVLFNAPVVKLNKVRIMLGKFAAWRNAHFICFIG